MLNLRRLVLSIAATASLLFAFSCAKDMSKDPGSSTTTTTGAVGPGHIGPGTMGPNHAMGPAVEHDASMPMPDGGHMR